MRTCSVKKANAALLALLGFCALFVTTSCNQMGDRPKDGFLIQGKIDKPEKGKFIALYKVTPTDNTIVDSVEADASGAFKFTGKVKELQMFMLLIYGQQAEFFVAQNEDVSVDIKGALPRATVDIKAGPEEESLKPILATFRRQSDEFQPMQYEYQLAVENRDMLRAEKYRDMLERGTLFYKARFKKMIDSLGPCFGSYTAATRLSLEEDFGTMDTLAKALETKYKGQKWASEFVAQVASVRALAVGQLGPLFSQTTPDGKKLGPADFKGKIVVLDFWASWCKPCRANSPAMVALYAKYKANGVEILGVSLDSKPDSWKKAIKEDNYAWPQVSELNMWDNSAAKLYKVEGIPHLVLLDKEGKIVARNLTPESVDILLTNMLTAN